jgi:hypothetical protein
MVVVCDSWNIQNYDLPVRNQQLLMKEDGDGDGDGDAKVKLSFTRNG